MQLSIHTCPHKPEPLVTEKALEKYDVLPTFLLGSGISKMKNIFNHRKRGGIPLSIKRAATIKVAKFLNFYWKMQENHCPREI